MAGPWERFKAVEPAATEAPAAGPWDKFKTAAPAAPETPPPAAGEGQTLMPEPILSGFLGTPDYAKTAHQDKVMGRAVLKGASTGFLGLPALASDAVSNIGYGAKKLANKAGLAEAPDPANYYGANPGGGYFPALSAVNQGTDTVLDKAGLDRAQTPGESMVSAGFEGAASGVGGFLAGKVAQAGGGAAAGLATGGVAPAAASGAVGGVAGEATAQNMDSELGRQLPDWTPAAVGMLAGAGAGGALSRAAGRAANARAGAAPTTDELRASSNDAYTRARGSGVEVSEPAFRNLHDSIRQDLDGAGIYQDLGGGPAVSRVLQPFEASRASGAPVPLNRMEGLRQNVGALARSTDPQEARAAQVVQRRLDRFLNEDSVPADYVGGAGPNAPAQAVADLREGRALWSRQKKSSALDDALIRAEDRTGSTHSGGNAQNIDKQEIRKMINPGSAQQRRVGLNAEETAQARAIVRGNGFENATRKYGKAFSPEGPMSMISSIGGGGALGSYIGGPVGAVVGAGVPVTGYLSKKISEGITQRKVDRFSDTIRRGYALPEVSGAPGLRQGAAAGFLANDDRKPKRGRYR